MDYNSQQVVFVADWAGSRETKLAYALKQAGWEVIILHKSPLPLLNVADFFKEAKQYSNPEEAFDLALSYTPMIYHVFSNWNFEVSAKFIRYKPAKIVFDDYDVMAGMVKEDVVSNRYPGQIELEKFCLENADGLCCRSLETQYAKQNMNYKYSGKRIFFPEYCLNMYQNHVQKDVGDCLNIANIGNLYIDPHYDINSPRNFHIHLALKLSKHGINSYLYLREHQLNDKMKQFLDKSLRGISSVHIKNLNYESLIKETSRLCHAGLVCAPPNILSKPDEIYRQTKREYAASNKVFDYIDAEMPIIIDGEVRFLFWMIKRYQKFFDFRLFSSNPGKYAEIIKDYIVNNKEKLSRARKTLSVSHHIQRLIRFYQSL